MPLLKTSGGVNAPPHETNRNALKSKYVVDVLAFNIDIIVAAMFDIVTPSLSKMPRNLCMVLLRGQMTCLAPIMVTANMANASTKWNIGET